MSIFSLIVFFGFIIMGMSFAGDVSMFIDVPTALMVFPTTFALTIAITSYQDFKNAFLNLVNLNQVDDIAQLNRSNYVFAIFGTLAIIMSLITMLIGLIAIGANLDNMSHLGVALAVALLSVFYGVLAKALCFVAQKKVQFRLIELNA